MAGAVRFSVSLEKALLKKFDAYIGEKGYTNRSEAIRDLIRDLIVEEQWEAGKVETVAAVTLVYDHEKLDLKSRITELQHEHHDQIVSTMHVHMDAHNCLEIVVLRGVAAEIRTLGDQMISLRGIKFGRLNLATTGQDLP